MYIYILRRPNIETLYKDILCIYLYYKIHSINIMYVKCTHNILYTYIIYIMKT